jgi:surface antigen
MKVSKRTNISKIVLVCWSIALVLVSFQSAAKAAGAQTGNPYPYGQSTYWAWQNRPDLPADLGVAADWAKNALAAGFPVSEYPRRGDIAVFQPGVLGADAQVGRVAMVEQVLEDGTYRASEMDASDCTGNMANCGHVNNSSYPIALGAAGTSFIHYKLDSRTTWGFASGQAGWTTSDLGTGNSGGPGWYYPLSGNNPHLDSPQLDVPLDYSYNAIEVEMVTGLPVADPTVKVFFATEQSPNFSDDKSVTVRGEATGESKTYRFYFGDNPAWKGTLTGLRLNPAGPGTTGCVRVDRVRLVQIDPPAPQVTVFSSQGNDHGGRQR